jgi:lipopolysaccharide transport system permease protein
MQVTSVPRLAFRAWQLYNPLAILRNLWHHRDLIQQMTRREVGQRYRGSYLGVLWSFITPLVMLLIYTFVFSVIFKARWRVEVETPPAEFALTLFAGLAAFNVFSEVVSRAPTLIVSVPNYVKKVVFPLEILPVVVLGSALVNSLISVGLLLVGALLFLGTVSATVLLLPLVYVPLIFLCLGLGWFLASLGVYIRDVGQGIGLTVQMLFFLSPVFFPPSAAPEFLRPVFYLNPLTVILTGFRETLLWGQVLDWLPWAVWTTLTALLAVAGYAWFIRTKKGFADVL